MQQYSFPGTGTSDHNVPPFLVTSPNIMVTGPRGSRGQYALPANDLLYDNLGRYLTQDPLCQVTFCKGNFRPL